MRRMISISRLVSSFASRIQEFSTVSPISTNPPGNAQQFWKGGFFRFINTMLPSCIMRASTAIGGVTGGGIFFFMSGGQSRNQT